jgi:hypothetical protein
MAQASDCLLQIGVPLTVMLFDDDEKKNSNQPKLSLLKKTQ